MNSSCPPFPQTVLCAQLRWLRSIAVAEFTRQGSVVAANDGLFHLLELEPGTDIRNLAAFMTNPALPVLSAAFDAAEDGGVLHSGILSFNGRNGRPSSLTGRVVRHGDRLFLLAEQDSRENELLLDSLNSLNSELSENQRALARANWQLAQEKAEQERLLGELRLAQAQLVQSAQLVAIGQLAAGVAHEVNNPISFVDSNLKTLGDYASDLLKAIDVLADLAGFDGDPNRQAAIQAVRNQYDLDFLRRDIPGVIDETREGVARVAGIVRNLREFSRLDETGWQLADLHAGLDSALNLVRHLFKGIEIVRDYGNLPSIYCCQRDMNQVFMNLLINASQAIQGPGRVVIRTGCERNEGWIEIADSGIGIPAENLDRIYDPFFTTKAIGQGTGLGLSSAWGIVNRHGGRIVVASQVGKGSQFRIWLPIQTSKSNERQT